KTVTTGRARPAAAFDPGALVMVGIEGKVLDAAQAAFLRRNRIRAVVLFRATFLPHPPAAMALGAAGTAVLAEEVGAAVARGVKSLGFNWNFAPVLDVNNNAQNP